MQLPPAAWLERKSEHSFRYHKRSRTVADVSGEAYLRLDLSCGCPAPLCGACQPTTPALSPSPRHLLLPDAAVLVECLDVFELSQMNNVVLLSSVVRQLQSGGSARRDARLRALYADSRRCNFLFDNLHHRHTAPASLHEQRNGLALLAAAEWYYEHLGRTLPVVGSAGSGADVGIAGLLAGLGLGGEDLLGTHTQQQGQGQQGQQGQQQQQGGEQEQVATAAASQPSALDPGVHVLSAAAYFGGCWGHDPAVVDVFDSIRQSRADEGRQEAASSFAFPPHLSPAALEAGLASRSLLSGPLAISRRSREEASVAVGGGRAVLVLGRGALNRAVHGDKVVVRLLPRDQWSHADSAVGGDGQEGEGGEEEEEADGGDDAEHDLLASTGNGDAGVAADAPRAASGEGETGDAPFESMLLEGDSSTGGEAALQPRGEVVGILQRWSGEVVASISEEDERALAAKRQDSGRQEAVLCVPIDRRLPKIRLRSRQLHRLLGQRLVLRMDGWDRGSRYPHSHLVRSLGPIHSLKSETEGVLVSSGVHWQPFSEGALHELPPIASSAEYDMPAAELASRRDLRGPDHFTCSIDPPGCTDVDDALSVRWLDGGSSSSSSSSGGGGDASGGGRRRLVEVGVHIADVSFFGSLLDGEAAARCTTVYLVDRRLDMLPALLSEDLCSLRSGADRYAVSVVWTLDADSLEVLGTWFGRTLIRSRYQLEYSQAQAILEGRPQPLQPRQQRGSSGGGGTGEQAVPDADLPQLQRNLRLLAALAERRRQMRLEAGAVELESAELRFQTDEQGQPTGVTVKLEIQAMQIVAEMMILANAAVGTAIHAAFPRNALLRRHPPPRREAFEEVSGLCESLGSPLDLESGAAPLAASLAAAVAAAPPALGSLIKSLATRAMSEAEYFCTGDVTGRGGGGGMGHFGLALPYYTHFTSPIRRYADVVVHRQLLAAVAAASSSIAAGGAAAPNAVVTIVPRQVPPLMPAADVAEQARVMNERHRTAKRAQKECSDLYLLLLLHSQPHVESATVYGLRPRALLIFLPKYHLRGVIHLTDKAGLCKPPLRHKEDEQANDPLLTAYRRGLALVADGGGAADGEAPRQLAIVEAASGRQVAAYRSMQRVWVELSADGSRAHGPRLRMRLLADEHPGALAAAAKQAAQPAGSTRSNPAAATASGRCNVQQQQQQQQRQSAYRPPGVGPAAKAKGPPPGFGPAPQAAALTADPAAFGDSAAATQGESSLPALLSASAAAVEPPSLAGRLQLFLEHQQHCWQQQQQQQGLAAEVGPLALEGKLPPLDQLPSLSPGHNNDTLPSAVCSALRKLRARAARLELRAGAIDPGRQRAAQCSCRAAAIWQQIAALQPG
ncbi:DIS3-like exonuclease 1 [Chlorella vulgaris]